MLGHGLNLWLANKDRGFSPLALFAASETGAWYDPSDLATLFQDTVGTTPVTAAAQTVALDLDKARGLVLGSEQVLQGGNEASLMGTTWLDPVGATNGTVARSTEQASGGSASAKYTSNTATSTSHYTTFGTVPAGIPIRITGRAYLPTGSLARLAVVDTSDGSFIAQIASSVKDAWVDFIITRPAKATAWPLAIGNNNSESLLGSAFYLDNVSVRELPGIHATQATISFRPAYQTAPQRLNFDGSDDRMAFAYNPTASGSLAVRINGATASSVAIGSQGATDGRAFIGLASDGSLGAGIGTQSTSTIKGTADIRNAWATGVVTWDGTTVRLYQNGAEVYSGAQSGAVNTTVPFDLGCLNNNATRAAFWSGGIGAAIALGRVMTPAEIASLHTLWSTII